MKRKLACIVIALAASAMAQRVVGPPGIQPLVENLQRQTSQQPPEAQKPGPGGGTAQQGSATKSPAGPGDKQKDNAPKGLTDPGKRRDPFVSPIKERSDRPPCTAGKSCLAVAELTLRGIVHTVNGDLVWVVNADDRAYFLRLNDPVMDGVLVKINRTSVVFLENAHDIMGHPITREVVKRLGPT